MFFVFNSNNFIDIFLATRTFISSMVQSAKNLVMLCLEVDRCSIN